MNMNITTEQKEQRLKYRLKFNYYKQLRMLTFIKFYSDRISDITTEKEELDEFILSRDLCMIKHASLQSHESYLRSLLNSICNPVNQPLTTNEQMKDMTKLMDELILNSDSE